MVLDAVFWHGTLGWVPTVMLQLFPNRAHPSLDGLVVVEEIETLIEMLRKITMKAFFVLPPTPCFVLTMKREMNG